MLDSIAVFATLVLLWIGFRLLFRRWLWRSAYARRMTRRNVMMLNAATFAILPLLALPWAQSTTAVLLLLLVAATVFGFEIAISKLSIRFDRSDAPPSGSGRP
jgi:hypothetical protein